MVVVVVLDMAYRIYILYIGNNVVSSFLCYRCGRLIRRQ